MAPTATSPLTINLRIQQKHEAEGVPLWLGEVRSTERGLRQVEGSNTTSPIWRNPTPQKRSRQHLPNSCQRRIRIFFLGKWWESKMQTRPGRRFPCDPGQLLYPWSTSGAGPRWAGGRVTKVTVANSANIKKGGRPSSLEEWKIAKPVTPTPPLARAPLLWHMTAPNTHPPPLGIDAKENVRKKKIKKWAKIDV